MGGVKVAGGGGGVEKVRCPSVAAVARSRMRPWVLRATTTVLLWTCVMQLTAVGERWGPRVLKGWPSCRTAQEAASAALAATRLPMPVPVVEKAPLPPKSEYPHYPAFACCSWKLPICHGFVDCCMMHTVFSINPLIPANVFLPLYLRRIGKMQPLVLMNYAVFWVVFMLTSYKIFGALGCCGIKRKLMFFNGNFLKEQFSRIFENLY